MGQIIIKVPGRINREFVAEHEEAADAVLAFLHGLKHTDAPRKRRRSTAHEPSVAELDELDQAISSDVQSSGVRARDAVKIVREVRAANRSTP